MLCNDSEKSENKPEEDKDNISSNNSASTDNIICSTDFKPLNLPQNESTTCLKINSSFPSSGSHTKILLASEIKCDSTSSINKFEELSPANFLSNPTNAHPNFLSEKIEHLEKPGENSIIFQIESLSRASFSPIPSKSSSVLDIASNASSGAKPLPTPNIFETIPENKPLFDDNFTQKKSSESILKNPIIEQNLQHITKEKDDPIIRQQRVITFIIECKLDIEDQFIHFKKLCQNASDYEIHNYALYKDLIELNDLIINLKQSSKFFDNEISLLETELKTYHNYLDMINCELDKKFDSFFKKQQEFNAYEQTAKLCAEVNSLENKVEMISQNYNIFNSDYEKFQLELESIHEMIELIEWINTKIVYFI